MRGEASTCFMWWLLTEAAKHTSGRQPVLLERLNLCAPPSRPRANWPPRPRQVERLEAARQRALARWRQPPVGRSGRAREAGAPDLYVEAAAAAWAAPAQPGLHAACPAPAAPSGAWSGWAQAACLGFSGL